MKTYQILDKIMLGFLTLNDSYDAFIGPGDGHLQFDGSDIVFVDNSGSFHISHTSINAIEIWSKQGKIKEDTSKDEL